MDKLLDRLYAGILALDLGIPGTMVGRDLLRAANMAMSRVGGVRLASLDDEPALRRAVTAIESAA